MSKGYEEKIKDLIGDLPIKIEFAQFIPDASGVFTGNKAPVPEFPYAVTSILAIAVGSFIVFSRK